MDILESLPKRPVKDRWYFVRDDSEPSLDPPKVTLDGRRPDGAGEVRCNPAATRLLGGISDDVLSEPLLLEITDLFERARRQAVVVWLNPLGRLFANIRVLSSFTTPGVNERWQQCADEVQDAQLVLDELAGTLAALTPDVVIQEKCRDFDMAMDLYCERPLDHTGEHRAAFPGFDGHAHLHVAEWL